MFSNGGKEHAVVLYTVLLQHTHFQARFFCEGGTSYIWCHPAFRSALTDALKKENFEVKILTRTDTEPDFTWLPESLRQKITVKKATGGGIDKINKHFLTDSCNFSVFDREMFRFEYDVERYKAYGSFNEETVGESMVTLFDNCFEAA